MFCENCGKNVPDGTRFCPHCGKTVAAAAAPAYRPAPAPTPAAGAYGYAPAPGYRAPAAKPSFTALLSMILGISGAALGLIFTIISIVMMADGANMFIGVGCLFMAFGVTLGLCASGVGLAFSIIAKKKGDRSPFSLVGLICSAAGAGLCLLAFIFLLVVATRDPYSIAMSSISGGYRY